MSADNGHRQRVMGKVESHRDLVVWQLGMDLVEQMYQVARELPDSERYGLVSQMTRAAVSVPANIAEGHAWGSRNEYAQFVTIARRSLMEVETYLMLVIRLGFLSESRIQPTLDLVTRIAQLLTSLRNRLKRNPR